MLNIVEYCQIEKSYTLKKLEKIKASIENVFDETYNYNYSTAKKEYNYFKKNMVQVLEYLLGQLDKVDLNSCVNNEQAKTIVETKKDFSNLIDLIKCWDYDEVANSEGLLFKMFKLKYDLIFNIEFIFESMEKS